MAETWPCKKSLTSAAGSHRPLCWDWDRLCPARSLSAGGGQSIQLQQTKVSNNLVNWALVGQMRSFRCLDISFNSCQCGLLILTSFWILTHRHTSWTQHHKHLRPHLGCYRSGQLSQPCLVDHWWSMHWAQNTTSMDKRVCSTCQSLSLAKKCIVVGDQHVDGNPEYSAVNGTYFFQNCNYVHWVPWWLIPVSVEPVKEILHSFRDAFRCVDTPAQSKE